jgi:hypothetical protein
MSERRINECLRLIRLSVTPVALHCATRHGPALRSIDVPAPEPDLRLPSDLADEFWARVWAPPELPEGGERCGKWMLFSHPHDHDQNWRAVRDATV